MIWCVCLYSLLHLHISDPCSFFYLSFYPLILHPHFLFLKVIPVIFHPVIVARFISCLLSSPNLLSKPVFLIVHHFLLISSPFPPLVFSPFLATIRFNLYSILILLLWRLIIFSIRHCSFSPPTLFSSSPIFQFSSFFAVVSFPPDSC